MINFGPYHGRILVVDDDAVIREYVRQLMTGRDYQVVTVSSGEEALAKVAERPPDVVLSDVNMAGLDGFEVCRRLKNADATRLIPVVLITGLHDTEDRVRGIEAGADDFLTKPFAPTELLARVASLMRLKHFTDELDSAKSVIRSLALTIESRDPCTGGHCERLAMYASAFGEALQLDRATIGALELGGYLHDVGKIGVPDAILLKPGPLDPEERRVMERHTLIGEQLIAELRSLDRVRAIVRHHHERLDGSGYPDRLVGSAIPIEAQILSIVDAFDALTTERPYKKTLTREAACRELTAEAERGWKDPDLVARFIALVNLGTFEGACHAA